MKMMLVRMMSDDVIVRMMIDNYENENK